MQTVTEVHESTTMSNDQGGKRPAGQPALSDEANDSPEVMMFNANLQEFAVRVGTICALEAGGKFAPDDAYQRIKTLWKSLKHSRRTLGVDQLANHPPQ
jgi:hypothetical protein